MKSPTPFALLSAACLFSFSAVRAGDPSVAASPKKDPAPAAKREAAEARPVVRPTSRYVDVRILRMRVRPPWAPAAPGD